jgi:putative tricarboxylic transport membrane protein
MLRKTTFTVAMMTAALGVVTAEAAWKPERPIEFVVTSGAGGGTDNIARTVQAAIQKNKLTDANIIVTNKGGGSGAEGFVYTAMAKGDPYKFTFATNNEYLLPYVAKLGYKASDLVPVAAMALDEFLIWVPKDSPYKDAKSFIEAAKAKPEAIKIGGSQSKDTDQTLVSIISEATGAKFTYIPFKSGGEAAVQLAGGHIDANVNNPNENIGQFKAGMVRPLCVFSPKRMAKGPKVSADMAWSDIPTCKESGIPVETYQMPRTQWLPAGVPEDAVKWYIDLLAKVRQTEEWKQYIERTSQTDVFMSPAELAKFAKDEEAKTVAVFKREGWLAQ